MALQNRQRIEGHVVLTLAIHREDEWWVGECKELGTTAYASTLEEAQAELVEFIELHLNTLEQTGERDHFFRKHGIKCYQHAVPNKIRQDVPVSNEGYTHARSFAVSCLV